MEANSKGKNMETIMRIGPKDKVIDEMRVMKLEEENDYDVIQFT